MGGGRGGGRLPCRLSFGKWRGLGPHWMPELGRPPSPPPQCSRRGSNGWGEPGGGAPGRSPFTFYIRPPGAASTRGQEVIIQQGGHPRDPAPGHRGPQDSRAHTRAHTRSCLSVRPSGPGLRPRPGGPCGRRRHGELGSALTLVGARPAGRRPFTSEGPRRREGLEAAGRGQTQSRPPKSWSWGCPGRPASTARRAPTGLGIPAGGGNSRQGHAPHVPPPPPQGGWEPHSHRWT